MYRTDAFLLLMSRSVQRLDTILSQRAVAELIVVYLCYMSFVTCLVEGSPSTPARRSTGANTIHLIQALRALNIAKQHDLSICVHCVYELDASGDGAIEKDVPLDGTNIVNQHIDG